MATEGACVYCNYNLANFVLFSVIQFSTLTLASQCLVVSFVLFCFFFYSSRYILSLQHLHGIKHTGTLYITLHLLHFSCVVAILATAISSYYFTVFTFFFSFPKIHDEKIE